MQFRVPHLHKQCPATLQRLARHTSRHQLHPFQLDSSQTDSHSEPTLPGDVGAGCIWMTLTDFAMVCMVGLVVCHVEMVSVERCCLLLAFRLVSL